MTTQGLCLLDRLPSIVHTPIFTGFCRVCPILLYQCRMRPTVAMTSQLSQYCCFACWAFLANLAIQRYRVLPRFATDQVRKCFKVAN